jgi:hypothetical protein
MNAQRTFLAAISVSLAICLTGCMSGKQRYKLHRRELDAQAKQARTYKPIEFKGIVRIEASDGIVINVPMEQLRLKDIPNDFKTGTDLLKWAGVMGLTGYAIKSATGDTSSSSVTNNNAGAAGE